VALDEAVHATAALDDVHPAERLLDADEVRGHHRCERGIEHAQVRREVAGAQPGRDLDHRREPRHRLPARLDRRLERERARQVVDVALAVQAGLE